MSNPYNLKVGQQLWYVPDSRRGSAHNVTITKIGRVWAEAGPNRRFALDTLWADGGAYTSPGRAYLSQKEHEHERWLFASWSVIRDHVDTYTLPDNIGEVEIKQLAAILGLTIPAKEPTQ